MNPSQILHLLVIAITVILSAMGSYAQLVVNDNNLNDDKDVKYIQLMDWTIFTLSRKS